MPDALDLARSYVSIGMRAAKARTRALEAAGEVTRLEGAPPPDPTGPGDFAATAARSAHRRNLDMARLKLERASKRARAAAAEEEAARQALSDALTA